jgi:acetoin:2,6-dichlorophenolindophenol oxidoreductase subunit beta
VREESNMVEMPVAAALNQALDEALAADPKVFLLGEDIVDPAGGVMQVTKGLSSKWGRDRVRETPISEQAIIGAATGAAMAGMRPVAEIMIMDFIAVAADQLINHAAKLRFMSGGRTHVPLTVRCLTTGGFQMGAQHSQSLEAWLAHVPGLKVAIPSNAADAKGLLTACIRDDDPCIFIEPAGLYGVPGLVPVGEHVVPLGSADVKRPGSDVTVISWGKPVLDCLAAAADLDDEIDVEVVDLRSIVPLDIETILASAGRTKRVVVVHQAVRRAGFGAEIAALIQEELFGTLEAPVLRVACKDTPVPYAKELEDFHLPQVPDIVDAIRTVAK